jgi:hypothetical protein
MTSIGPAPDQATTASNSVAAAFQNTFGYQVVSIEYLGLDKFGSPIYKIGYRATAGGVFTTGTVGYATYSVVRDPGFTADASAGFKFIAPDSKPPSFETIPGVGDVPFRPPIEDEFAVLRASTMEQIANMVGQGFIDFAQGQAWTATVATAENESFIIDIQQQLEQARLNAVGSVVEIQPIGSTQDNLTGIFDSLLAGLGGGGPTPPVYVKPDERVIQDFVKGTLVSLVGNIPETMVGRLLDIYMRDHRANFDNPEAQIDPAQSVLEAVRNSALYQQIHKLRPDSVDERTWISDRRAAAQQGGLNVGAQEDFAILQATLGGDLPDVVEAAGVSQLQTSGRAPSLLDAKLRSAAATLFSGVRI